MDDLSRALGEALLREINCPVCIEFMVQPLKLWRTINYNLCILFVLGWWYWE